MKRTLSILVENSAGVLSQVTRLFSRKNWNIDSLAVGETQDPSVSRITVMVDGSDQRIRQVQAQLGKLLPVISVCELDESLSIHREFMLVKVRAEDKDSRDEIISIVNVFRASIVDICRSSLMIAITGDEAKNGAMLALLKDFGILELARTGMIALERGSATIYDKTKDRSEFDYAKSVVPAEEADA
ncbi:MAG: acetolactate synthase small subunit [Oscillospiraceae bacterium]|nr:acetolactate synthase small subunit [Oscillospiraceae bacterium]